MTLDWYIVFLAACGIPVQAWLGWKFGKGLVKAGWALGCAVSVCRWGFAVGRVHGFSRPAWRWVPGLFLGEWWNFFVSPYDSITQYSHGGTWRGIGNWSVFPKAQEQGS
jgi:hypothetical protein